MKRKKRRSQRTDDKAYRSNLAEVIIAGQRKEVKEIIMIHPEVIENILNQISEHGSVKAACDACGFPFEEFSKELSTNAELADRMQLRKNGCIGDVTSRLFRFAMEGDPDIAIKASNLFLKRHGALTDVHAITQVRGLAEVAIALQEKDKQEKRREQEKERLQEAAVTAAHQLKIPESQEATPEPTEPQEVNTP